jgi:PAS domain S-box-containing protein
VPRWPQGNRWFAVALLLCGIATAVGVALDEGSAVRSTLVLGPVAAAFGAGPAATCVVALFAFGGATAIGASDGVLGEAEHWVRALGLLVAGGAMAALAAARERRERELLATRPGAVEGLRLRIALDAGDMGTWTWDRDSGLVEWDERLEALFGLARGGFAGTFDAWAALLHPEDRDRVLAAVDAAVQRVEPFRFDHRVVWPDGSVHWLEGRGEPVVDRNGRVVGAAGVTIDIDARRRAEAERAALHEAERDAREQAERSHDALVRLTTLTMALSGAATIEEVGVAMVRHGVTALGAQYGWFGVVDEHGERLLTRSYEGYAPEMIEPYANVALEVTLPATEALRTGSPIFVESEGDRRRRYPQFDETVHGAFVVVPIDAGEGTRGVMSFSFDGPRAFSDDDRRYIAAVIEACAQALRRAALLEAEQHTRARLRTVLELSERLATLDDPEAVLDVTARFAAQRIGRYASIYVSERGELRRITTVHGDGARDSFSRLDEGIRPPEFVARVARSGEGAVVRDVGPSVSAIAVPMRIAGRLRGVIVIADDRPTPLGAADLELATEIGRRSASAHERATLWRADQDKLEAEHRMVEVLQRTIVPERLPALDGVELAAVYRPADVTVDVGGDWYDAFVVDGRVLLVVGDVAGHGIEAASLMGRARNALRAYAVEDDEPARLLERVDRLLGSFDTDTMVTAVVGRFDPRTGELSWARAGHPPPLVCDATATCRYLEDVNSTPLGTVARGFESARTTLGPGCLVVLYTDGLVERRDCAIDDGLAWLAQRVERAHDAPLPALCRSLADEPFVPLPSNDDICVLALRVASG